MESLKDYALKYLQSGFSVIPLKRRQKLPLVKWEPYQQKKPTEQEIEQWWAKHPDANIGLITGVINDIVVFDEDAPQAKKVIDENGGFSAGPQSTTGKGHHYLFKHPGFPVRNNADKKLALDIRGDGGYIVAPPSIHPSGKRYEWAPGLSLFEAEPPELRPWQIEYLKKHCDGTGHSPSNSPGWQIEALQGVTKGQRNQTSAKLAGRYIRTGLSDEEISPILFAWNQNNSPPLPEPEIIRTIQSVRATHERKHPPPDEAAEERAAIQDESREAEAKGTKGPVSISVSDLLQREFEQTTPVIGDGILPKQAGMILAGEGGVGKSLLVLESAVRLVMGWKIFDVEVPTARTVKIFQAENPLGQVQFRLKRILQGFQITGLPDRIFFSNPRARYDLARNTSIKRVKDQIQECAADVFILDPLSSFHHISENDNIAIRGILDNVTHISRETGAAAIIVHHFGKPSQDRQDNAYRFRGAMSIRDWSDTLISITYRKHESKILRQIDFNKIRNGPMKPSLLVERDENFIHEIVEEDMIVSVSKVKEVLETLFGGRAEKQQDFVKAIARECGCSYRTAQRALYRAVEMKVVSQFDAEGKAKGYAIL